MPKIDQIFLSFALHKERWQGCTLCDLCKGRKNVVLLRGVVPADVLFCGEAPGESEDVWGYPFVEGAPAGSLLEKMIARAGVPKDRYAVTNVVACVPRDEAGGKVHAPPQYAAEACAPRLLECLNLVKPKLVIWVGKEAAAYGPYALADYLAVPFRSVTQVEIIHPAATFHIPIHNRGLRIQEAIVRIAEAFEDLEKRLRSTVRELQT